MSNKVAIIRREHFNAAHRLHNSDWDDETNREIFGKCNNPNFHGHNYEIEVKVTGDVNPKTGFVINVSELKSIIREKVTDRYDHKNLNLDVNDFKDLIPTAENIARKIYQNIVTELPDNLELKIKVYETPRNIAEYPG